MQMATAHLLMFINYFTASAKDYADNESKFLWSSLLFRYWVGLKVQLFRLGKRMSLSLSSRSIRQLFVVAKIP